MVTRGTCSLLATEREPEEEDWLGIYRFGVYNLP